MSGLQYEVFLEEFYHIRFDFQKVEAVWRRLVLPEVRAWKHGFMDFGFPVVFFSGAFRALLGLPVIIFESVGSWSQDLGSTPLDGWIPVASSRIPHGACPASPTWRRIVNHYLPGTHFVIWSLHMEVCF